jgi:hypothetical protein
LNNALAKNFISEAVYAYQPGLNPSQNSILIGGIDTSMTKSEIAWQASPVVSTAPNSWLTSLQSLAFGEFVIFNSIQNINAEFVYGYLNIGLNSTLW